MHAVAAGVQCTMAMRGAPCVPRAHWQITCGSSFAIAAAALAPLGQLHLFFPPKEVPARTPLNKLREHSAFQTQFMRRNTVPLDFDGRPFPEYKPKLTAMLDAIDAGRRPAASDAWSSANEKWLVPLSTVRV